MTLKLKALFVLILFSLSISGFSQHLYESQNLVEGVLQDKGEGKFSLHRPNYTLIGKDDAKLQFSAKYRLVKEASLFIEYTQKMFWDIYEKSSPFRDINYHPGLFYRFTIKDKRIKAIDIGYLHSSNGEDGEKTRSHDQVYVKTSFLFEVWNKEFLSSLEFYETFNEDKTNQDIQNFIGYYKLTLLFRDPIGLERLDFAVSGFAGKEFVDFNNGGYELNLRYQTPFRSFNPDILFQYFKGHAENLLEYNKKQEKIRLGLLFYL